MNWSRMWLILRNRSIMEDGNNHRENTMFSYIWPIALVILSNVCYQICAKSVNSEIHPLASLTVTYLIGAIASGVLYFILSSAKSAKGIRKAKLGTIRSWNRCCRLRDGMDLCIQGWLAGQHGIYRAEFFPCCGTFACGIFFVPRIPNMEQSCGRCHLPDRACVY